MHRACLTTFTLYASAIVFAGCNAVPPVTFTIDVDSGESFGPSAMVPAGTTVHDYEVVTSDFIGLAQLYEIVRQNVGTEILSYLDIEKVELLETILVATEGNFDTLQEIHFDLRVSGSAGEFNTSLGSASAASGLGTRFSLVPEQPVDLLVALNPGNQTPPPAFTQFVATVSGSVPAQQVTFDTKARLRVTVSVDPF